MSNPAPVLATLPLAPHGGPDGAAPPTLDFSVNSNPFGPPPDLMARLRDVDLASYPDPTYREARAAAAAFHGVSADNIVLGGAADIIYRLAACYLDGSRRVVIAAPTFGEYARASLLHRASVHYCPVYGKDRDPDTDAPLRAVRDSAPTLVWLCQPNNPTGHAWRSDALFQIAQGCEAAGALLVIDAAYLELSGAHPGLPESAVQLVPPTKTFALAGLRAGYAVAPPHVAEVLRRSAPPWPVSNPAQAAVSWCRSPAGAAFVVQTVPGLLELRRALQRDISAHGLDVWESASCFFLLESSDPALAREARAAGFRLRDTGDLGLPGCVRIAAQTRPANEALLARLRGR